MADQNKNETINLNLPFDTFDVNEGVPKESAFVGRLPSEDNMLTFSVEDYASRWGHMAKSSGGISALAKNIAATSLPPYTQSFGRISYMPNNSTSQLGVLQWPGLPPESLQKLAREMLGVQMIVNLREADVLRYADLSDQAWRPGWNIRPLEKTDDEDIDEKTKREMREAEDFILNSGYEKELADPLVRDGLGRCSFSKFLLEIVRDSLIYDGIAIWVDRDEKTKRISSYAPLPAGKIRLLARPDLAKRDEIREGTLNFYGASTMTGKQVMYDASNPPFAVAVDETNNIVDTFTRDQLIWYTRNPRVDAEVGGYGYPEIEMALILVTGFNNAIQFNADIFDKNSIPKGILAIKGNFTQRQFDALGRIWDNLQRGQRTDWTLPAIQLSEKGEIEVINLEPLRKEPAYYNNLINLFMGALATVYTIPVHRLGYKISGTERDSRPDTPKSLQEDQDVGLPAILTHLELVINNYLIHDRWPHLKFVFTGKSTKEDAREYEAKILSMTFDEKRTSTGLRPYEKVFKAKGEEEKLVAKLMANAPMDPGLAGIYQSMIAALAKGGVFGTPIPAGGAGGAGGGGDLPTKGARMTSKKDPAKSETHGHMSGVRRDSKLENPKLPKTSTVKPGAKKSDVEGALEDVREDNEDDRENDIKQPPNLRRLTDSPSKVDTSGNV
jgi:hypothetical protein